MLTEIEKDISNAMKTSCTELCENNLTKENNKETDVPLEIPATNEIQLSETKHTNEISLFDMFLEHINLETIGSIFIVSLIIYSCVKH